MINGGVHLFFKWQFFSQGLLFTGQGHIVADVFNRLTNDPLLFTHIYRTIQVPVPYDIN